MVLVLRDLGMGSILPESQAKMARRTRTGIRRA
jgi:hypothetical protein